MGRRRAELRWPELPASLAVEEFWRRQKVELEAATMDFNERMMPMSRLKRVIRVEEDAMMISADTPAFLAKMTELFVQELTVRAWACAQSHQRRMIVDSDMAEAVASTESFDFLVSLLLRYASDQGGSTSAPSSAKPITRKRRRPHQDPVPAPRHLHDQGRREVHFPMITAPAPAPALSVHYMSSPHMLPPPSMAYMNTPAAIASYYPTLPVAAAVDPFAVGNTGPTAAPTMFLEHNMVDYCWGPNGNGAAGAAGGNQQEQNGGNFQGHHHGTVQVEQDGAVLGAGDKNQSLTHKYVEEILMGEDDDDLFPDSDPLGLEDLIADQDVLDGAFFNPSSSTASTSSQRWSWRSASS